MGKGVESDESIDGDWEAKEDEISETFAGAYGFVQLSSACLQSDHARTIWRAHDVAMFVPEFLIVRLIFALGPFMV